MTMGATRTSTGSDMHSRNAEAFLERLAAYQVAPTHNSMFRYLPTTLPMARSTLGMCPPRNASGPDLPSR